MQARSTHYLRKATGMIAIAGLFIFSGCAESGDENYLWLLGLAGAPAAEVPGTVTGETESVPFTIDVTDVSGDPNFLFETTQTINLYINIVDPVQPVVGSRVRVFDVTNNGTGSQTLFQAVSNPNGNVTGSFTVNRTTPVVILEYEFAGQTYSQQVDITYVQEIRRTLNLFATVGPVQIADADGDGIADDQDAYPDDPERATRVRYPGDGGYYTVAFEDLYPTQGDADFNDYVLTARYEADLNAQGALVRLRGDFTHQARGAGYRHTLHLTLAGVTGANLHLQRFSAENSVELETNASIADFNAVMILPPSDGTIAASNTQPGSTTLQRGKRAAFELIPGTPVNLTALGPMPFDLFLKVVNTGHEIHFPGRYQNADGSERYIDGAGFPWALLVPGDWRWPYERQNIHAAYPEFQTWYSTSGQFGENWYINATSNLVVPYF